MPSLCSRSVFHAAARRWMIRRAHPPARRPSVPWTLYARHSEADYVLRRVPEISTAVMATDTRCAVCALLEDDYVPRRTPEISTIGDDD